LPRPDKGIKAACGPVPRDDERERSSVTAFKNVVKTENIYCVFV
jgi:hypothetical protein